MAAVLVSRLHSATRIVLHSRRYLSLVFISLVLLISLLSSHHHHLRPLSVHSLSLSSFRTRLSSIFFQPKGQTVPELQQQAYALSGNRTRPTCPWQRFHSRRYRALALEPRNVFVAMNFWNNAEVLPTFFQEIPKVVEVLGRSRVFVSVYENGSEDGTAEMLQLFGDMLSRMGVAHRVIARGKDEYTYKDGGHRISALASIRNAAMDPLYTGDAARALDGAVAFDDVLWVNDVHHCAADLLEVVYQKRLQGANQACGVDWAGWGDHVIYDRWVLRTITGRVFYLREELLRWVYPADDDPRQPDNRGPLPRLLPYADSQADKARFESNLPIQVFSCWNGVTAIDASAFLPPNDLRFRVAKADLDEEGRPREATELISECFLSSVDLWSMGKGRIVLAPRASVAYNWWNYDEHRKDQIPLHPHLGDEIIKDWVVDPPAAVAFQDNAKWDEPERWGPWNEQ